jgi:hypothetical protein
LHIGCNNYSIEAKSGSMFKNVSKSHEEVKRYKGFFKEELGYHLVSDITDELINQKNLR